MLNSIYVKDFVLLEQINLNLYDRFSAFTGETGAGKSLLMDAIGILKGDRFSTSQIKHGKEKAIIEGVFDISKQNQVKMLLNDAGYEIEDDLLIVSRECNIDGKSKVRINHRVSTVSFLKQIMSLLVDLHSQHDSQQLLNPKTHRDILDRYVHNEQLMDQVKNTYQHYSKILNQLNDLLQQQYDEDDLEEFTNELNKLSDLNITEDELDQLNDQLHKMSSYEKVTNEISNSIYEINKDQGILEQLYDCANGLSQAHIDNKIENIKNSLMDCYYNIQDNLEQLKSLKDSFEFDEYEYQKISDRITVIKKCYRKYGNYEGYQKKIKDLEENINQIIHKDDLIKKQTKAKQQAYDEYLKYANKLHDLRISCAKKLEQEVKQQLLDLCLPHAQFAIQIKQSNDSKYGYDDISFYISMNPGEVLRPLNESASGGELSRFMLGLKCVFTKVFETSTIIFDEIDSGVSGKVAFAIGKKMQELAKYVQVFSVTHLAQVAACAHQHYHVSKIQDEKHTHTNIELLDNQADRIYELARITSNNINDTALKQAEELLMDAKK